MDTWKLWPQTVTGSLSLPHRVVNLLPSMMFVSALLRLCTTPIRCGMLALSISTSSISCGSLPAVTTITITPLLDSRTMQCRSRPQRFCSSYGVMLYSRAQSVTTRTAAIIFSDCMGQSAIGTMRWLRGEKKPGTMQWLSS